MCLKLSCFQYVTTPREYVVICKVKILKTLRDSQIKKTKDRKDCAAIFYVIAKVDNNVMNSKRMLDFLNKFILEMQQKI